MKNDTFQPYKGEEYIPIQFLADSEELAEKGKRVILRHKNPGLYRVAEIIIAPINIVHSGWVIGMINDGQFGFDIDEFLGK